MIPMNDFRAEYQSLHKEIDEAIHRVLTSGWHILGKEVESFEREFAEFLGVKRVIGVANGLEAIQLGLMALGIGPGDEVITTPLSAVATALAITNMGATPVFADIDAYYHLDPKEVEKKITSKTKAVLPVHLYGQSADISGLQRVCKKHNIFLLEDAAQAHGAKYGDAYVGGFGTFGAFSFYPTKNLGAYGDGGAISTNDEALADHLSMLRNYGQKHRYEHLDLGLNSRLDELQAAILRVKLKYLAKWNARRHEIANMYAQSFSTNKKIQTPISRQNTIHAYHLYVIQIENRNDVMQKLQNHSITALIHYPTPIHKQPCYPTYHDQKYDMTETAVKRILSLPIHPFLSNDDVNKVIDCMHMSL